MLQFLEFLFIVAVLYVVTQLFLPLIVPGLHINWLFRKRRSLPERVDALTSEKEQLNNDINTTLDDADAAKQRAIETHKQAQKLKK